LLAQFK